MRESTSGTTATPMLNSRLAPAFLALGLAACGVTGQRQELVRQGQAWIELLPAQDWATAADHFVYNRETPPERVAEMLAIVLRELGEPTNAQPTEDPGRLRSFSITTKGLRADEAYIDIPFLVDFAEAKRGVILIRFDGFLGSPKIQAVTFGVPLDSEAGSERIRRALEEASSS